MQISQHVVVVDLVDLAVVTTIFFCFVAMTMGLISMMGWFFGRKSGFF